MRASRTRDSSLFLLPLCLRLWDRWARLSFRSARRRNFGDLTTAPSDRTANAVKPRSIPTSEPAAGNRSASAAGSACTTKLAKYRPAASLMIATLDGADGKLLDQRTSTSPTFGSRNFPLGSTANWAFVVNRADCRRSLRDFGRGRPIFGPLRAPDRDSKKFRYAAFRSARDC